MRTKSIIKKISILLSVSFLMGCLTGCQQKVAETPIAQSTVTEDNSVVEESTPVENVEEVEQNVTSESEVEKKEPLRLKEEDLSGTYWRAVYYETFRFGEAEEYVTEYDDDYYRFMDVTFADDKSAEFRSIVGDNYESTSGMAQWRITDKGDVILENMTPFEGMGYGHGFIPRFTLVDSEYAPNDEEGMLAIEYMEGCVYFRKMEKSDPFEGVDLANSARLRQVIEHAKIIGQDITGEWVLLSSEEDGYTWYAYENGVECTLYIGDTYASYQYTDSSGYREAYYGMNMTYDDNSLYSDMECEYSIYFKPYASDYEGRYEYLSFGMAPDKEFLIVQMSVQQMGEDSPTQKYYVFQRGFG